ncbi:MAG: hypothetical protein IKL32_01865 [Alphaproteobacteria bacterium]|nr:hypothetical protein [Alphaproteobacteria bacterium]
MKDIELNKQRETQERLKKALMAKKKQQLQAKREAYRRSQMDEFRDGMVSLVTDPETKERPKEVKDKDIELPIVPQKSIHQKGFKRPDERVNAFKMAKRRKGRAA